jgi:transketolase
MTKSLKVDIMTAFFNRLSSIAKKDKNVFFITADHGAWALSHFKEKNLNQYLNIGISEQNMVSVAAGMSLSGHKVFIFTITPFLIHRALEQIKMDVSYPSLPVTIIGNGSSLTYANHGSSHQSVDDVSIINNLPNFEILHPSNNYLAEVAVDYAYNSKKPIYVKLDKGFFPNTKIKNYKKGFFKISNTTNDIKKKICIFTTGVISHDILKIVKQHNYKNVHIYEIFKIKPIDKKNIVKTISKFNKIITIEEQHINGGIGNILSKIIVESNINIEFKSIGINDFYSKKNGDRNWLRKQYKLDDISLSKQIFK